MIQKRDLSLLALLPGLQAARDQIEEQIETILGATFGRATANPPTAGFPTYETKALNAPKPRKSFSAEGKERMRQGMKRRWRKTWEAEAKAARVPLADVIPENSHFRAEILAEIEAEQKSAPTKTPKLAESVPHHPRRGVLKKDGTAPNYEGTMRAQRARRWKEWDAKAKTLGVHISEVIPKDSKFRRHILHEVAARERREKRNNTRPTEQHIEQQTQGAFEQAS